MEKSTTYEENQHEMTSSLEIGPVRLSDKAWEEARRRAKIIQPLLKESKITEKEAQDAAKQLGVSTRTVFRMLERYKTSGELLSALAPQPPTGGVGKVRINEDVEIIIRKAVRELYLDKQKRKISKVVQEIRRRCVEANITPPGQNTIRRRISQLSSKEVIEKREGKLAAHPFIPNYGPAVIAQYPLEIFVIDHTKVDIIVVDEQQRLPIGRPWLSLAIDVFSKCIAGFYLSFDDPSAVSVGLCLTNAVFDKTDYLKKFNIPHSWPLKGKPEKIQVDNGSDFTSEALKKGCEQHGITIQWRKVGAPHLNGIVERVIGTFMKEIHEIPGTTFSNISERGNYNSNKMAVLTMPELEHWLAHAIVGKYHLWRARRLKNRFCPVCVNSKDIFYPRLLIWRTILVSSCPYHKCLLVEEKDTPWDSLSLKGNFIKAHYSHVWIDNITIDAIKTGNALIGNEKIDVAIWIRFLRSFHHELSSTNIDINDQYYIDKAWVISGFIKPNPRIFELLEFKQRVIVTSMAAYLLNEFPKNLISAIPKKSRIDAIRVPHFIAKYLNTKKYYYNLNEINEGLTEPMSCEKRKNLIYQSFKNNILYTNFYDNILYKLKRKIFINGAEKSFYDKEDLTFKNGESKIKNLNEIEMLGAF